MPNPVRIKCEAMPLPDLFTLATSRFPRSEYSMLTFPSCQMNAPIT